MIDLYQAGAHVRLQRGQVMVIKIGGACLARKRSLVALARQIALIHAFGAKPLIVHGGGPQTDSLQAQFGESPRKVGGRRVTSPTALKALQFATLGGLNSDFTAALCAEGAPALGLCAASAHIVRARRRPPMATDEGPVDFGLVGDIESIASDALTALLDAGQLPVLCPPASDGEGGHLNVNADTLAAEIAGALGASKLILVTDAAGILADPQDPQSLLSVISLDELQELETRGVLQGGMAVKATAMRTAFVAGVARVHVVSGLEPDAVLVELYTNQGSGTLLCAQSEPQTAEACA